MADISKAIGSKIGMTLRNFQTVAAKLRKCMRGEIYTLNGVCVESFAPIRRGKGPLGNGRLEDDLYSLVEARCD